ncbi:MAG TPA: BMP family ABC transporter substrate-binding protein [Lachnoclostridium phytofermentans]|uniref:BMP family ABC transporter substrate-binding protein n=1 Tax=Lachnoclostridium phytofermentans TaxID=66219 RepID=A0A3D2X629_9FIRM|nr:BMP family ABC transporter substrate-binding protein [Lachnoclostridium sp.]HCL02601.1 BMP family ABC transporter substrate-binding protein [Lachnoclostridium phytofermentans]
MKKKALSLLMAVTLAATLFTGCGKKDEEAKAPVTNENSGDEATKAPVTNENSGDEAKKDLFAPIAKEDLKIGVIHITNPAEGSGYTYTHDVGIQGMQKNIGLNDNQIIRKNNVNDQDPVAIRNAIEECIEEGAKLIFATSWGYMDTVEALAAEHPDVIFSHGTGYKSNGSNFNNYFGRIYQARYLTGIAAGLKTTSNKIGYVAAWGKENSEVTGGLDAFAMGVYSVNPDAKVYVKTTNSWFSPEGEAAAAEALIALGCDVIGQHCDTPNPMTAAEAAGVFGVGYNSDMSKDAPKAVLTSALWDWSAYYTTAVKSVIDGTWDGSNYFGGMAEGLINISPLSDLCAPGTEEKVAEAEAKIKSGEWDVFAGAIETNDGQTIGEEGKSLDDATITGGINWYFKNVVEN